MAHPDDHERSMRERDGDGTTEIRIEGGAESRELDPAEALVLGMRLEAMAALQRHLVKSGWTQAEAARRMRVTQPRVSKLKRGRWQEFSLDMLLTLAARVGLRAELHLAE